MLDKLYGAILGSAIGDALGSPFEFMNRNSISKVDPKGPGVYYNGQPGSLMAHHRAGDVSDDTYMSMAVLAGAYRGDTAYDMKPVLQEFMNWYRSDRFHISAPGIATTKAFSVGHPATSEGNGACMKAHVSAVLFDNPKDAAHHATLVARITHESHTGMNEAGAKLTVYACRYAMIAETPTLDGLMQFVAAQEGDISRAMEQYFKFIRSIDLDCTNNVSGWVLHTVSYAIKVWLTHPDDFLEAVRLSILIGGDTDTTAAVTGGIVGSRVGKQGLPVHLVDGLLARGELEDLLSQALLRKDIYSKRLLQQ